MCKIYCTTPHVLYVTKSLNKHCLEWSAVLPAKGDSAEKFATQGPHGNFSVNNVRDVGSEWPIDIEKQVTKRSDCQIVPSRIEQDMYPSFNVHLQLQSQNGTNSRQYKSEMFVLICYRHGGGAIM